MPKRIRTYADLVCSVEGCDKPVRNKSRMLCTGCYWRFCHYGDPRPRRGRIDYQSGSKNPSWRGDDVSYSAAHIRIRKQRGIAAEHSCVDCGGQAEDWSFRKDAGSRLTDEKGRPYSGDPMDYEPRCKKCHFAYDEHSSDGHSFGTLR